MEKAVTRSCFSPFTHPFSQLVLLVTFLTPALTHSSFAQSPDTQSPEATQSPELIQSPGSTSGELSGRILSVKFASGATRTLRSAAGPDGVITQDAVSDGPVPTTGFPSVDHLNQQYQAIRMERIFPPAGKHEARHRRAGLHRWYRVEFARDAVLTQSKAHLRHVAAAYASNPRVAVAEPLHPKALPHAVSGRPGAPADPRFSDQWSYHNTGQASGTVDADIDLPEARQRQSGRSEVIVQLVDSGVDIDHPDLADAFWVNNGEDINGNGRYDRAPVAEGGDLNRADDDGNGYIDDVIGYNHSGDSLRGTIRPSSAHGTHTAGTIGATSGNRTGVAGVAGGGTGSSKGVRLMISQVFGNGEQGGFAEAIVYGADNGATISNNSWGYRKAESYNQVVLEAIDYFIANAGGPDAPMNGGLFVASAGNANSKAPHYPAAYEPALAVAATNDRDERAGYSNYGTWVDLSAPGGAKGGQAVLSTIPGGRYGYMAGTSSAAPHVAGVAALVASERPGLSAHQVRTVLTATADGIDDTNPDYAGLLGHGRVNAARALGMAPDRPALPPSLSVRPSSLEAQVVLGETATRTFTVANDGDGPLEYAAHATLAGLSVDPATGRLAPGATQELTLTISPKNLAPGSHEGALLLRSNDPDRDSVAVFLRVTPRYGDVSLDGRVDARDAPLLLRHLTGQTKLGSRALAAGEVSGNDQITAYDAALILGYASENTRCFPVEDDCPPHASTPSGIQEEGIARLTWGTAKALSREILSNGNGKVTGSPTALPLELHLADSPVRALQVNVHVDPTRATVETFEASLPDGWTALHHVTDEGLLRIVMVGPTPLEAGPAGTLKLRRQRPGAKLRLGGEARLNEASRHAIPEVSAVPLPEAFTLKGNYPNPFRTQTRIAMDLPEPAQVTVNLYDALGRKVMQHREALAAGSGRTVAIEAEELASGMYIYRLTVEAEGSDRTVHTGKMMLVR